MGGHRSISVAAVDARAHAATSSAGRMVDRFVPRIRIPFTAAVPGRVRARSGGLAREAPPPAVYRSVPTVSRPSVEVSAEDVAPWILDGRHRPGFERRAPGGGYSVGD
jgi:hypothetical protein